MLDRGVPSAESDATTASQGPLVAYIPARSGSPSHWSPTGPSELPAWGPGSRSAAPSHASIRGPRSVHHAAPRRTHVGRDASSRSRSAAGLAQAQRVERAACHHLVGGQAPSTAAWGAVGRSGRRWSARARRRRRHRSPGGRRRRTSSSPAWQIAATRQRRRPAQSVGTGPAPRAAPGPGRRRRGSRRGASSFVREAHATVVEHRLERSRLSSGSSAWPRRAATVRASESRSRSARSAASATTPRTGCVVGSGSRSPGPAPATGAGRAAHRWLSSPGAQDPRRSPPRAMQVQE